MRRPEGAVARAEAWLFAPGDPRRLAALRIGLGTVLALRLATGPYLELARQPAALFRPISFLHLLHAMPPPAVVAVLQVAAAAAAVLAAAGVAARVTLPLAWVVALPLVAMTSSLGKVVHNDVLLLLSLVALLPARTADAWSPTARRRRRRGSGGLKSEAGTPAAGGRAGPSGSPPVNRGAPAGRSVRYGWPVRTATVVVAGAYFFTGLGKLLHAGPAWVTSGNLRWVLYASSDQAPLPNHAALFVADRPWLAHLVALATLVVELGFPLVLLRPRAALVLVPCVLAMHAGIWVAMGLNYWPMAATVVLVMVDWAALADRLRPHNQPLRLKKSHRPAPDSTISPSAPG
ncbi:MAG TPA: hypothetical protein VF486_01030 [Actinomycetes bacterium]